MTDLFAIHSVFIAKENILFLEEWIDYHILIGFDKFYLYDNSKVVKSGGQHPKRKCFVAGKVNKYGIDYNKMVELSNEEITQKLNDIQEKYKNKVFIMEWSPKNKNGVILHKQKEAHNHCLKLLKKNKIKWCANIDMDEYIVVKHNNIKTFINNLNKNVSNVKIGQIRFMSRFNNVEQLITSIDKAELKNVSRHYDNKNIYKVANTTYLKVHIWWGRGKQILPARNVICFNHYKKNNLKQFKTVNNISSNIKDKVKQNSINYLLKQNA